MGQIVGCIRLELCLSSVRVGRSPYLTEILSAGLINAAWWKFCGTLSRRVRMVANFGAIVRARDCMQHGIRRDFRIVVAERVAAEHALGHDYRVTQTPLTKSDIVVRQFA